MKKYSLSDMHKGWFIGNFDPAAVKTDTVEVAYRPFYKGATEPRHVHHIATELTVIVAGELVINGHTFKAGDIVLLEPGESAEAQALTDGAVVVVKTPSVPGDKYDAPAAGYLRYEEVSLSQSVETKKEA